MVRTRTILVTVAAAIFFWLAFRAATQSITIDEATSYEIFAARGFEDVFVPANNNHLLNTLAMHVATRAFGLSHLAVRSGALLGAALYLAGILVLLRRLHALTTLKLALLLTLTVNPLIADFLVAARGYGLSLGLIFATLAIGTGARPRNPLLRAALCSIAAGLAFCSSFAYAFAIAAVLAGVALLNLRRELSWPKLAAATILPGLIVTALIAGRTLAHWPAGELWFGSKSPADMADSLTEPSLARPDPYVISIPLYRAFEAAKPWWFPLAGLVLIAATLYAARAIPPAARTLGLIFLATLALHLTAFYAFGLLLPKHRTGLFFLALATLYTGYLATTSNAAVRRTLTATLWIFAILYLACLRTHWFSEWRWNAAVHDAYRALDTRERAGCVHTTGVTWRYIAAFNFYRDFYGHADRQDFNETKVSGRDAYFYHPEFDQDFAAAQHLTPIAGSVDDQLYLGLTPDALRVCEASSAVKTGSK